MKKYIALALLLVSYAHAQVSIQGSNVQIGGSAGGTITGTVLTAPPGSQTVTNMAGTTTGFNSANNVLWADGFPGADICAKINAAQASVAGTSGAPIPSVLIVTSPGQHYAATNQCVIANDNTFPYIHKVMLDFQGSTFIWNGASGTAPILVLGENSQSPLDTGWIKGSGYAGSTTQTFTTSVAVPALISNSGRPGFGIIGMSFNGNNLATACYSMINTTATGGIGFNEESYVALNNFDGCLDGIALHRGSGGSDSMDYSWFIENHFQLENANNGLHEYADEGFGTLDLQGIRFTSSTNAAGGTGPASTVRVDSGSNNQSWTVDMAGENTSGNGFYDFNGANDSISGLIHSRGSLGLVNGANFTTTTAVIPGKGGTACIQCSQASGEVAPLGRSYLGSLWYLRGGQNVWFYGADEGSAPEQQGVTTFSLLDCLTSGGNPSVLDAAVHCQSNMYWEPNGGPVYFGLGHGESGTGAIVAPAASNQFGNAHLATDAFAVTPSVAVGGPVPEYGIKWDGTGYTEYTYNGPLTTTVAGGATGTAFTGTCPPTTTITVVNGRITGCS